MRDIRQDRRDLARDQQRRIAELKTSYEQAVKKKNKDRPKT